MDLLPPGSSPAKASEIEMKRRREEEGRLLSFVEGIRRLVVSFWREKKSQTLFRSSSRKKTKLAHRMFHPNPSRVCEVRRKKFMKGGGRGLKVSRLFLFHSLLIFLHQLLRCLRKVEVGRK